MFSPSDHLFTLAVSLGQIFHSNVSRTPSEISHAIINNALLVLMSNGPVLGASNKSSRQVQ